MPCGHGRNNSNYTLEKILERRQRALIRKNLQREHQHRVTSKEIDLANLALKHPEQRFIILTILTVDIDAYYKIVPLFLSPFQDMEAQLRRLPELESNSNSTILQIEMSNDQNAPASSSSSSSKPASSSRVVLPYYILADKSEPSVLTRGSESTAENNNTENSENNKNVSDKSGTKKNPKKKGKKKKKYHKKKGKEEKKSENPASESSPVKSSNPVPPAGADLTEKSDTDDAPSWTDLSDRCGDISGSNSDVSDNDELAVSVNKPGPVSDLSAVIQPGAKLEIVEINKADCCNVDTCCTSNGFLPVASGRKARVRKLTGQTGNTGRVMNGFNVNGFNNGKNNNRFSVWQEKGKKSNDNNSNSVVKEQQSNKQSNKTENNIDNHNNSSNLVVKEQQSNRTENNNNNYNNSNNSVVKEQQSIRTETYNDNNNFNLVVVKEQQSNKQSNRTENNNDNYNNSNYSVGKEQQSNKQSNRTEIWVRSKEGPKVNGSKFESGKVLNSQEPKPDLNNNIIINNSNNNQGFNFRRGRQVSKKNNNSNNNNNSNGNGVVIEELRNPMFKKDDFPILPLSSKSNSKETQKHKAGNRGNPRSNEKLPCGAAGSKKQSAKQVEKSEQETQNKNPNLGIKAVESEEQSGPESPIQTQTLIHNPKLEIKTIEGEERSESETQAQTQIHQTQTQIQIQNPSLKTESTKAEEQSESETQTQSPNSESKTIESDSDSETESETLTESPNPNSELQTLESEQQSSSSSISSSNSNSDSKSLEDETNESNHDTCPSDSTHKNTTNESSDGFNSYSSSSSQCSSPASIAPISPVIDLPCLDSSEIDQQTLISRNTDLDKIRDSVLSSLKTQTRVLQGFNNSIPFADYERFLNRTSPVLGRFPLLNPSCNCTENGEHNNNNNNYNNNNNAIYCCHEIPKIPLREIWRWYEEPGCYGLEVRGYDKYTSTDFKAHFVPYLSAVQLFAWPDSKKGTEIDCEMESESGSELANLPIFSKLLPKQSKDDKEEERNGSESRNGSNDEVVKGSEKNCGELAFEFFESEQPHNRMSVFEKIKQLVGLGGAKPSKGQMFGDPQSLESVLIMDLHPSSWYSIAWYPAYRVPEGQFKAAFLTYHSLGHFITTQQNNNNNNNINNNMAINGGSVSLSVPVVGLQYYNDKGESWFDVRDQTAKPPSPKSPQNNPSELVRERLSSLSQTSSIMARAKVSKNGEISMNHHGDFEFFRSRSRPNYF